MRWIRRIAATFVLVLIVWAVLLWSDLLPRPTAEQRVALAALEAVTPPSGERNAFAFLQFAGFDVDDAQLEQLAADDMAAFEKHLRTNSESYYESPVARDLKQLPFPSGDDSGICPLYEPACLARIAADPQKTGEQLGRFATGVRRSRLAARFDHYRTGYVRDLSTPTPSLAGLATLLPTAAAFRFSQGDRTGGMVELCDFATGWRRLRANSDSLLIDMLGAGAVGHAAQVYGGMLAQLPLDEAVPALCVAAFAPLGDAETDQCRVWASEFELVAAGIRVTLDPQAPTDTPWLQSLAPLLENAAHTRAAMAPIYARYCSDEHRARRQARSDAPLRPLAPVCPWYDQPFNPVGCLVVAIAMPELDSFWHRVLDLDDRLRLVQVAQWLRSQEGSRSRALGRLPDNLKFARLVATGADEGWIEVDLRLKRGPGTSRIPISPVHGASGDASH